MKHMRTLLIICILALTAACQNTWAGAKKDTEGFRMKTARTIYPEGQKKTDDNGVYIESRPYCYKTWSDVMCYDQPQPGQEDREIPQ